MTKWYEGSGGSGEQMEEVVKKKTGWLEAKIPDKCRDFSAKDFKKNCKEIAKSGYPLKKPEQVCKWKIAKGDEPHLKAYCKAGYYYESEHSDIVNYKFCPYCGLKISWKEDGK